MKFTIMPGIIAANGRVTRGLKENSEALTGTHSKDSLEKTTTLGTTRIIQEVPLVET
jgi:hypothetical protein